MKVAIITDTHYGCRKNSKVFHDYFLEFYKNVFFPTIDEQGIKTIVHMGDAFDSRKGVDFSALLWAKNNIFDPIKERGIDLHLIVGNHDVYYKNTNSVNAVDLLLREYDNVKIYADPQEVMLGDLNVLFIPWINQENEQKTLKLIKGSSCKCAMGHLELRGFAASRGHIMEEGLGSELFKTFTKVFSGHYHVRSSVDPIYYLGNPYEMFWNDVKEKRGFHIFDTETLDHTPVNNPYRMFYNIYYEDTPYQTFDTREYENKIVKVIVRKKSNPKHFEKFIDKIFKSNVHELKIVENFQVQENDDFEAIESEDTLSILNRYITESETQLDTAEIQRIINDIYREACEMV